MITFMLEFIKGSLWDEAKVKKEGRGEVKPMYIYVRDVFIPACNKFFNGKVTTAKQLSLFLYEHAEHAGLQATMRGLQVYVEAKYPKEAIVLSPSFKARQAKFQRKQEQEEQKKQDVIAMIKSLPAAERKKLLDS